jgi:hypothetical protein
MSQPGGTSLTSLQCLAGMKEGAPILGKLQERYHAGPTHAYKY